MANPSSLTYSWSFTYSPSQTPRPCLTLSAAAGLNTSLNVTSSWSNFSSNCSEIVDVHTRVHPYPPWVVIFLWLLTIVFSVETILGNLLVLMAYKLERNIRRQLSNKFIVSLAITDLIIGMEGFPLLTGYVVGRERWPLGNLLCEFWLFLDYTLCLVSILNVLLITVDRYGSVCYPAKYRTWQTRSRVRLFIFGSWIVPCILFGMVILAWEPMTGQGMDDSGKCYAPFLNDPYVNMSMYIIYYWSVLGAMTVLYRGIHIAAKTLEDKSKARERQTIALLLGQRCMAQVGVGMIMHSSVSDEDDENIESFFHSPNTTADGGYVTDEYATTELIKDPSSITATTSATMANTLANSLQCGYVQLQDDHLIPTSDSDEKSPLNVPVVVTPVVSMSLSSMRVPDTPSEEKDQFIQRRLLYSEFGEGEDEDEEDVSFSLVPLIDRSPNEKQPSKVVNPLSSTNSLYSNNSPVRAKIFNSFNNGNTSSKRSSSFRRVLAPMHSYGGVASIASKARRTRLIGSLSLDEDKIGSSVGKSMNQFDNPLYENATLVPKINNNNNTISNDSRCSLEYYDSNKSSVGSLYGDTSLHSVFDFGNFVQAIETTEIDSNLMESAPGSMENSMINSTIKIQSNGNLIRPTIPASSTASSLSSVASSKTWTRSESTSIRSQLSMSDKQVTFDQLPITATIVPSSSSPANLIHLADENKEAKISINIPPHSYTQNPVSARPSVQIKISPDHTEILTPIMEEKSSASPNPNSPIPTPIFDPPSLQPSSLIAPGQGTRRQHPDQKVVHLTVPGSSSASGSNNLKDKRKGSSASTTAKKGTGKPLAERRRNDESDWQRASWQSTASSVYDVSRNNSTKKSPGGRRMTQASHIDDDDDSCGSGQANINDTRAGSTTEDYPADRKGSHWLVNLFNNPTSILNRKRKVTKAERRARKAFRTITVIVGTFALFWSPYYIVATIYGFCPDCVPAPLFLTSYYLCYLNSSVNPFAYAFANRLFRKTFIRILKGDLRRT